jgi:fructose-bisphosphate aldolase class II
VSISSSSWQVYKALSAIPNSMFTIAAAFGNVHGVYKAGNVQLRPEILGNAQAYAKEQLKVNIVDDPCFSLRDVTLAI